MGMGTGLGTGRGADEVRRDGLAEVARELRDAPALHGGGVEGGRAGRGREGACVFRACLRL